MAELDKFEHQFSQDFIVLNSNTSRSVVYSNNFNITNNIGIIGHEIQKSKILSSIQSNLAITSTTTTLLLL